MLIRNTVWSVSIFSVVLSVYLLPLTSFSQDETPDQNIVDIASSLDDFTTLVSAVVAADLVDVLKSDGPFTVFAPTNAAFEQLPEGTLESLLQPENIDTLTRILTYHVVPGLYLAEDVVTLTNAKTATANQQLVHFSFDGEVARIDGAAITSVDVLASNGVIHVIDSVIIPDELPNVVEIAAGNDAFSTLVAALQRADLVEALQGDGPYTVFAPTDEAFGKLPEGAVETLLQPENLDALVDILTYHVVPAKVIASEVVSLSAATALNGKKISISITDDGNVLLNNAQIIVTDIDASNGVIHVIDTVLIPHSNVSTHEHYE